MPDSLAKVLTQRIAGLAPRHDQPQRMTPPLAYGRHRGPAPETARRAAVAITLLKRADGTFFIPLTLRPKTLKHHGGQVSFPGGKVELGESDLQAAMREFEEELGLSLVDPIHCGSLPPLYVFASNNLVSPQVLVAQAPSQAWRPDVVEVERVIELPLETLLQPKAHAVIKRARIVRVDGDTVDEFKLDIPSYAYQSARIWGATAMLLEDLSRILPAIHAEYPLPVNVA